MKLPGGIGVSHLKVYDDGGTPHLHTACTEAYAVVAGTGAVQTLTLHGGLALRGRGDWTDTRLLLSDGTTHDRLLGVEGDWLDLSGTVEGTEAGVLLLDHPQNHRHPVPWYASTKAATYGDEGWSNFANAAFLWHAPLEWPADQPLPFRFRIVVHDGAWDVVRCAAEWERYADV